MLNVYAFKTALLTHYTYKTFVNHTECSFKEKVVRDMCIFQKRTTFRWVYISEYYDRTKKM